MGLLVKLDTNGTNSDSLRRLINHGLLDFIAMDLKAPLSKYETIAGTSPLELLSIRKSVNIIKNSGLAHEFRTTFCPGLEEVDILRIILDFKISSNYVLQGCRSTEFKKVARNKADLERLIQRYQNWPSFSFRGFELVKQ